MTDEKSEYVSRLTASSDDTQEAVFEEAIEDLESTELALLLESLPVDERWQRWTQVLEQDRIQVLVNMRGEPRQSILERYSEDELQLLLDGVDAECLIELSDTLPDSLVDAAYASMNAEQRRHYESSIQYTDDQIGRYVDHGLLIFPQSTRAGQALRQIRKGLPDYSDQIYLVLRNGVFAGVVPIKRIYAADPSVVIATLILEEPTLIAAETPLLNATEKIEHSGQMALPVVDSQNILLGRLTLRIAIDLVRVHYESKLMATAGLNEDEDLFSPIVRSSKRRAIWLGINLLTAFLASWAIGLFEATLQQVVALAVLMPIVASMGGIAGSQTLTLMIRGFAMGQISKGNIRTLITKEVSVGVLNGVLWAIVIGASATLWFESVSIGLVIAGAIVVNIIAAALAGVLIPIILERLKIDPALSGSVILTTVTDVVGFVTFLGLGTRFLVP